jgi:hypothetical protein
MRNLLAYEYIYIYIFSSLAYEYIYTHLRCWDRDWLGQRNEEYTMTSGVESSHLKYKGQAEEYIVIYVREISFKDAN